MASKFCLPNSACEECELVEEQCMAELKLKECAHSDPLLGAGALPLPTGIRLDPTWASQMTPRLSGSRGGRGRQKEKLINPYNPLHGVIF